MPPQGNKSGRRRAKFLFPGQQYPKTPVELELMRLRDPLKLANHILGILQDDDAEKALELVRVASKDVECTVSWNHLIDYFMNQGKVNPALKLYNEVRLGSGD